MFLILENFVYLNIAIHDLTIGSVVLIIGSAIGNSRLLGNFVTIGIGGFQSYSIGLII